MLLSDPGTRGTRTRPGLWLPGRAGDVSEGGRGVRV